MYPHRNLFAKPTHTPTSFSEQVFTKGQKTARKDIDSCLGGLKARLEILQRENRCWDEENLRTISEACILLHKNHSDPEGLGDI